YPGRPVSPQIIRPWSGRIGPVKRYSYKALITSYISMEPYFDGCAHSLKDLPRTRRIFLACIKFTRFLERAYRKISMGLFLGAEANEHTHKVTPFALLSYKSKKRITASKSVIIRGKPKIE